MKHTNSTTENVSVAKVFGKACQASCQKILSQITAVKEAIFAESFKALNTQERLLRLSLNEAEAAAWQTEFPHLVFPTLAMEKVQAVVAWNTRQHFIRQAN